MKPKKFLMCCMFLFLLLSVCTIAYRLLFPRAGDTVSILVAGQVQHCLPLYKDNTIEIPWADGTKTVICQDKDGGVWVESAPCPDQICVKQGRVSSANIPIVCLPCKLVIQIDAANAKGGIPDAVTG